MPSENGSVVVCCCDGSVFQILQDDTAEFLFQSEASPSGICSTVSGHVIICFPESGRIMKIDKKGKVMKVIHASSTLYLEKDSSALVQHILRLCLHLKLQQTKHQTL